jgi:hypothetical protein
MIHVGLDDTDVIGSPGTNKLARHIARQLAADFHCRIIVRHQLLVDCRVPCTNKNGSASITFEPRSDFSIAALAERLSEIIVDWSPDGADPGLCIATNVPRSIVEWGLRCQRELVDQRMAHELAAQHGLYLAGLAGTRDGVIGALAAVGLFETGDDGRIVYVGGEPEEAAPAEVVSDETPERFDMGGVQSVAAILHAGVDEIRRLDDHRLVGEGAVDLGKRLRPNRRRGKVVLLVSPLASTDGGDDLAQWRADRIA